MVGFLDLAAQGACDAARAEELDRLLDNGALPELEARHRQFAAKPERVDHVVVPVLALADYDALPPGLTVITMPSVEAPS